MVKCGIIPVPSLNYAELKQLPFLRQDSTLIQETEEFMKSLDEILHVYLIWLHTSSIITLSAYLQSQLPQLKVLQTKRGLKLVLLLDCLCHPVSGLQIDKESIDIQVRLFSQHILGSFVYYYSQPSDNQNQLTNLYKTVQNIKQILEFTHPQSQTSLVIK